MEGMVDTVDIAEGMAMVVDLDCWALGMDLLGMVATIHPPMEVMGVLKKDSISITCSLSHVHYSKAMHAKMSKCDGLFFYISF
ncbi:hypothetical protein Ddc_10637 [Ditylenchus destructor]|nr:hypothetical protein Ddc_10637 [Ditylenchus destructor]